MRPCRLLLSGSFLAALLAAAPPQGTPAPGLLRDGPPVRYVEASAGLVPPTLDGGFTEIEIGDVDRDGHVDLVSVGDHGSPFINTDQHGVMVWFGDGRGAFSVFQFGNFGYGGVALGDVDGDGKLDVGYGVHHDYSTVDLGDQLLEVARGDGTGRSWSAWDDGLAANGETWGMAGTDFADVDGDGDLDVGAASFGCCAGVHVYLNRGDGTWTQSFGFVGGNSSHQFRFGDLDADGDADFVTAHQLGTVYLGDGRGGFVRSDAGLPAPGLVGLAGLDIGDVDGDGRIELGLVVSGEVQIWTLAGGTWSRFATSGLPQAGTTTQALRFADADGDGALDVISFGRGAGDVFLGDGRGGFSRTASFASGAPGTWTALNAGDVDHNGRPDIVLVAREGSFNTRNKLRFFRETSTPKAPAIRVVAPGPRSVVRGGSVTFVDWASAVPVGTATVILELSVAGPLGPWQAVASGLPDNGRHQWHVPATPSPECRVRATLVTTAGAVRALSAPFAIR
jgi:hypothetical protein